MSAIRLFIFSIILSSTLFGKDELFFERVKVQLYGNIGLTSVGIGGDFAHDLSWDIFYGYVPKSHGGVIVNTLSGKLNKTLLFINNQYSFYSGIGLMHVFNQRYRSSFRDKYPEDNYYQITSTHLLPYLGVDTKERVTDKDIKLYFEVGTIDVYLTDWYKNRGSVDFDDIINFAFGASYDF